MPTSVFAKYQATSWPHRYTGTIHIPTIAGGTPTDPNVAEGWLRTKLGAKDDLLRDMVAEVMADRGVTADEAAKIVDQTKHLNGFKRDNTGLYIEGRQLKAALKEAASVAVAAGKLKSRGWGATNKGLLSFMAEHVHIVDDRLHLGVTEPSGIMQRFVHTFRGTGIQYEEYVSDATVSFTVEADYQFTDEEWALIWSTGERQGIGASRSQGFGRYTVTGWEKRR
jgi:hypothetical protein